MRGMSPVMALGTALALAGPVHAQAPWAVSGAVGVVQVVDDEGSIGSGPTVGAGLGRALTDRLSMDVQGARVRPFLAGGAGVMRSTGTVTERRSMPPSEGGGEVVSERPWTYTGFGWEAGTGLDIALGARMFVRPEVTLAIGQLSRGAQVGVPEPPLTTLRLASVAGWRF